MRAAIVAHGGHEINTAGDGFFVAFERAGDAVAAAVAAQHALQPRIRRLCRFACGWGCTRQSRMCTRGVTTASACTAPRESARQVTGDRYSSPMRQLGSWKTSASPGRTRRPRGAPPQGSRAAATDPPGRGRGLSEAFPPLRAEGSSPLPTVATMLYADIVDYAAALPVLGDDEAGQAARAFGGSSSRSSDRRAVANARYSVTRCGRRSSVRSERFVPPYERGNDSARASGSLETPFQRFVGASTPVGLPPGRPATSVDRRGFAVPSCA